jgi:ketosteroid isomerase-like protein
VSEQTVELVRGAIEAFNRRDFDALAKVCHEDFEFVSVLTAIDASGATYRGVEAWREYFVRMDETWDDWRVEDVRFFEADDDRLAVIFRLTGRGKSSGAAVEREVGASYTFRDGKLWRMHSYGEPQEALEAVGLAN